MTRIDSHIHFDVIDNKSLAYTLKNHGISSIISWAYTERPPTDIKGFKAYFENQHKECQKGQDSGLEIYRTVGIHPRNIPKGPIDSKEIYSLLKEAIKPEDVVGIGEIGLEKDGTQTEQSIFNAQLQFAQESNLPVCIHTPRENKENITHQTLEILNGHDIDPKKVLIDHITDKNILKEVIERGHYAGITISNSKSSVEDAVSMIEEYKESANRIMINSDAVNWDPEEYQMFLDIKNYLNKDTKNVLGDTARNFFNI